MPNNLLLGQGCFLTAWKLQLGQQLTLRLMGANPLFSSLILGHVFPTDKR